jgi:transcriptional regulator with XRE-family HTH domain
MTRKIGQALKAARSAKGLSLRALERIAGLSASQISQIEGGRPANPGWETVVKLARALDMSLDAVAGLRGAKPPPAAPKRSRVAADLEKIRRSAVSMLKAVDDTMNDLDSDRR